MKGRPHARPSVRLFAITALLAIPLACGGGSNTSGTGGSGGKATGGTAGVPSGGGAAGTPVGGAAGGGSGGALGGVGGGRTGVAGHGGAGGSAGGSGGHPLGGSVGGQGGAAAGGSSGMSGAAGTGDAGSGAAGAPAAAVVHTTNLIADGDAEDAVDATDPTQPVDVPGWTITGHGTALQYGLDGYPGPTDPGPANRGTNLFIGGTNDAVSTFSQEIDLSGIGAALDTGTVEMTLDGYFGGYSTEDDNASLAATFQGSSGQSIGSAVSIGAVLASDRNDVSGLFFRSQQATVPAGTRSIAVVLTMTRAGGAANIANDGYADNLELFLNTP